MFWYTVYRYSKQRYACRKTTGTATVRSSGHESRLTAGERAARALDERHSVDSMKRSIREQLAGADGVDWELGWE